MNKSTKNTEDFICEQLNQKIKILENIIENFENLPSQYKYLWDKDIEDMTEEEHRIYYKAIPSAKLDSVNNG